MTETALVVMLLFLANSCLTICSYAKNECLNLTSDAGNTVYSRGTTVSKQPSENLANLKHTQNSDLRLRHEGGFVNRVRQGGAPSRKLLC